MISDDLDLRTEISNFNHNQDNFDSVNNATDVQFENVESNPFTNEVKDKNNSNVTEVIAIEKINTNDSNQKVWIRRSSARSNSSLSDGSRISQRKSFSSHESSRAGSRQAPGSNKTKVDLASFRRSLRLLGLEPQIFISSKDTGTDASLARPASHQKAQPRLCTRVMRRSSSLSNLQGVIQDVGTHGDRSLENVDREVLSKAVYEEWYFQKLSLERRRRDELANEEKSKQRQRQQENELKLQKTRENFVEWKRSKSELQLKTKGNELKPRAPVGHVSPEKAADAYNTWLRDKDKLRKDSCREEEVRSKLQDKKKQEQERRQNAQTSFKAWKQQADEALRKKAQELEKMKGKAEEKKRKETEEKEKNARTSFVAWKKQKEREIRSRIKESKAAQDKVRKARMQRLEERTYEADQAFEEWLDQVEERFGKRREGPALTTRLRHPYPWVPGGICLS